MKDDAFAFSVSSSRPNSRCVLSSLSLPATSKSFKMQNNTKGQGVHASLQGVGEADVHLSLLSSLPGAGRPSGYNPGGRDLPARALPGAGETRAGLSRVPAVRASSQQGAAERQEWSTEDQLRAEPREPTKPALRSRISHRQAAGFRRLLGPSSPPRAGRAPRAMASPSGSSEDTGKLRGRDGRQRREEEDAPPEEKRLRLGLEGGSAAKEEAEDAPRLGREETGTQTGGEGRGVSELGREARGLGVGKDAPRRLSGPS